MILEGTQFEDIEVLPAQSDGARFRQNVVQLRIECDSEEDGWKHAAFVNAAELIEAIKRAAIVEDRHGN